MSGFRSLILNRPSFSPVVFGDNLKVSGTYVPGNVIASVPELRNGTISNVCIAILPDGSYISSCTGASSAERVSLFKSDDRGGSWYRLEGTNVNANGVSNYYNLFVHNGSLYMMGAGVSNANVVISRSDDGGMTWTVPTDGSTGILAQGNFHSAAVPVAVSGGRIWRAMEEVLEDEKHPFVMSAPADADLLSAANWTRTNNVSTPDGLSYLDAPSVGAYRRKCRGHSGRGHLQYSEGKQLLDEHCGNETPGVRREYTFHSV